VNGGRAERIESTNQAKGPSVKTVWNINQVISPAMDFAKDQKLIMTNPTDSYTLPKLEHWKTKTLFLREAKETGILEMGTTLS